MEPISATIAVIAAAKGAVETASNIKDIGKSLEALFSSHEGAQKKPKTKPKAVAKSRMQQILRMRTGEGTESYEEDSTSYAAIANSVIQEKQQALALKNLALEVDKKWGANTWNQIIEQRQRLLKEKAAAEQLLKENALKKAAKDKAFWHKVLVETGKVALIICFAGLVFAFLWWASSANISQLR